MHCKFCETPKYFIKHKKEFSKFCKNHFKILKNDSFIKSSSIWLSWENLFNAGLTLEDATIHLENKFYQEARLYLPANIESIKLDLHNLLITKYQYNIELVEELMLKLNLSSISSINLFIDDFYARRRFKNNSLSYFINRGWSESESIEKRKETANTYPKFLQNTTPEKLEKWKESRIPGIIKAHTSHISKFQKILNSELLNRGFTLSQLTTKNPIRTKLITKKWFSHDFFVNNSLIVEYNGSYFHNDITVKKWNFKYEEYFLEIYKAFYVARKTGYKFLIIWERDCLENVDFCIKLINFALNSSNQLFFSSRQLDYEIYSKISLEENL